MGEKGFNYLHEHYHVSQACKIIKDSLLNHEKYVFCRVLNERDF